MSTNASDFVTVSGSADKFYKKTSRTFQSSVTSGILPTPLARDFRGCSRKGDRLPDLLTFLPADFHAKASRWQARDGVQRMLVGSGQKCFELFDSQSPASSLRRMCQVLFLGREVWHSSRCVLTWKVKVMRSRRFLFQLALSTLRIAEIESGLLPTPTCDEPHTSTHRLRTKGGHPVQIGRSVYDRITGRKVRVGLSQHMRMAHFPTGRKTGVTLRLQPAMYAWMMGFPDGWCDFPIEEQSRKQSGARKR